MKTWLHLQFSPIAPIAKTVGTWQGVGMTTIRSDRLENDTPVLRHWAWYGVVLSGVLVVLDQLSKWATTRYFGFPMSACKGADPLTPAGRNPTIDLSAIGDITLICNRGISWGLLQGDSDLKRWGLSIFAVIMTGILLYALAKTKDRLGRLALALIIAGAVGNAIDRTLFGAVTDMLDFSDIGFNYIFNVADSYITVGVVLLLVSSWITDRNEKRAAASRSGSA